jgi:hypothetical protein
MTELERLAERIESAMYWGADTPEKIAERLIDEGVICPPCKVGDVVWFVHYNSGKVCEATIVNVEYNYYTSPQEWIAVEYASPYIAANNHYKTRIDLMFGKTVFLTREEAEAALAERHKSK